MTSEKARFSKLGKRTVKETLKGTEGKKEEGRMLLLTISLKMHFKNAYMCLVLKWVFNPIEMNEMGSPIPVPYQPAQRSCTNRVYVALPREVSKNHFFW